MAFFSFLYFFVAPCFLLEFVAAFSSAQSCLVFSCQVMSGRKRFCVSTLKM